MLIVKSHRFEDWQIKEASQRAKDGGLTRSHVIRFAINRLILTHSGKITKKEIELTEAKARVKVGV